MRSHALNLNLLKPAPNRNMNYLEPTDQLWDFDDNAHSRKSSQRISHGIAVQVGKFERMAMKTEQRQHTPPFQTYGGESYSLGMRM